MKICTKTYRHRLEIEVIPGNDGEVYLVDSDHLVDLTLIKCEGRPNQLAYTYTFPLCIGGESCCRLVLTRNASKKWTWVLYRSVEYLQNQGVCEDI